MGVKGLWELLHPVARPIKLETLANKQLAIDASIWLHQFLRGMRDQEGQAIGNAHLIGFFRRICKLLFYNIKPIFVYDGGTPALKRKTIQERQRRKHNDVNQVKRTAEKLLAAQLRLHALEQRKAARKKKAEEKKAQASGDLGVEVVHDSIDDPKYLEYVVNAVASTAPKVAASLTSTTAGTGATTGSNAKRIKDNYVLPPMDTDFETLARIRSFDERFGFNPQDDDDVNTFLNEFKREGGVANIDSDVFKALPSELQYEILHDIRMRSRVTSYERVQEMVRLSETPMDFSKLQVEGVIRRNNVTHKLLSVNQAVSKIGDETSAKPGRIASQRNRQYLLVKNEEGGWVLGGKQPSEGVTAERPVNLDPDEEDIKPKKEQGDAQDGDEDEWESDDEADVEFEEVKIPNLEAGSPKTAVNITLSPRLTTKVATPSLPQPSLPHLDSLVDHPEAYMDEDESIEKVMAKFAQLDDEQSSRRTVENNHGVTTGLGIINGADNQDHEAARLRLVQAGHSPDWPNVLSDHENSFDTLNPDQMTDYSVFDDLVEDENTGEIITRQEHDLIYNLDQENVDQSSNGRALSTEDENRLDQEAFFSYWTGHTAESFKARHDNHEWMIRDAVFDWTEEDLEGEKHSATRKLDKSNVNDVEGIEALGFWSTFLTSVLNWRKAQELIAQLPPSEELSQVPELETVESNKSPIKPKSRLSQAVLFDDDDSEDDNMDSGYKSPSTRGLATADQITHRVLQPTTIAPPEMSISLVKETKGNEGMKLDLSTSIFRRKPATAVLSDITPRPSTDPSTAVLSQSTLIEEEKETTPPSSTTSTVLIEEDAEPEKDDVFSVSDAEQKLELSSSRDSMDVTPDDSSVPTKVLPDQDDEVGEELLPSLGELNNEDDTEEQKDEDVDEDEDEEMDLENEEHNFTQLFPEMATLPGAFILAPKAPSPPPAPVLSAEEQAALDQQDATRMFQESRALESEIKVLQDQRRKQQRNADDLTETMVADTQMLLKLFGIPYIVAPMEAEAQCADLQIRGVVDGILTEDSDVFLFGGMRVFKNMFKEEKFVECYLMTDIERDLGVGRNRLVELAYLLGSDYTPGIKGIGLVTAMEILRLFPKLENFAKWWRGELVKNDKPDAKVKDGIDDEIEEDEWDLDSVDEIALDKLAKSCKKIEMPTTFPDPHIADAYIQPMVDDDPTRFQWGIPDLDGLRDYLRLTLGWDRGEVDRLLLPIIRQMSRSHQEGTQTTLDGFFDASVGTGTFHPPVRKTLHKSARLRKIVSGLTGGNGHGGRQEAATPSPADSDSSMLENSASSKKAKKAPAKRKPAATTGSTGTSKKQKKKQSQQGDGEESSGLSGAAEGAAEVSKDTDGPAILISDSDSDVAEPKTKSRKTTASSSRAVQLRVPEAVTAAKKQLQSKNVEVKLAARKKIREEAAAAAAATSPVSKSPSTTSQGVSRRRPRPNNSDTSSGASSGSEEIDDDFAPSHWDLLAGRQGLKGPVAGAIVAAATAPSQSPTGSPAKLNANRYTTSFRTKDGKSTSSGAIIPRSTPTKKTRKQRGGSTTPSQSVDVSPPSSPSDERSPAKKSKLSK